MYCIILLLHYFVHILYVILTSKYCLQLVIFLTAVFIRFLIFLMYYYVHVLHTILTNKWCIIILFTSVLRNSSDDTYISYIFFIILFLYCGILYVRSIDTVIIIHQWCNTRIEIYVFFIIIYFKNLVLFIFYNLHWCALPILCFCTKQSNVTSHIRIFNFPNSIISSI